MTSGPGVQYNDKICNNNNMNRMDSQLQRRHMIRDIQEYCIKCSELFTGDTSTRQIFHQETIIHQASNVVDTC